MLQRKTAWLWSGALATAAPLSVRVRSDPAHSQVARPERRDSDSYPRTYLGRRETSTHVGTACRTTTRHQKHRWSAGERVASSTPISGAKKRDTEMPRNDKARRQLRHGGAPLVVALLVQACGDDSAASPSDFTRASADVSQSAVFSSIVAQVPVANPWGIAVRDDGLALVTSRPGSVALLDAAARQVLGYVPVGGQPIAVAFTRDGNRAIVANQSDMSLSVLDIQSRQVTTTVSLGPVDEPLSVAMSVDGTQAFVGTDEGNIFALDLASFQLTLAIRLPRTYVNGLAVDSSGTRLYASGNSFHAKVYEISLPSLTTLRSFDVGGIPQGIVVSRDGTRLIVANEGGAGFVSDIDLLSGSWTNRTTSGPAFGLADLAQRGQVVVLSPTNRKPFRPALQLYSIGSKSLSGPLGEPGEPRRGAVFAFGKVLLVTAPATGTVDFIN